MHYSKKYGMFKLVILVREDGSCILRKKNRKTLGHDGVVGGAAKYTFLKSLLENVICKYFVLVK